MTGHYIFVYLAYGGWQFRKEAILSISSLQQFGPIPGKILVFTDLPAEFESLPVQTALLEKQQIKNWRGPYGYTHRVKIELVREVLKRFGNPVIFIDSDTFWITGPAGICSLIQDGLCVFHEREPDISETHFPEYLAAVQKKDLLIKEGLPAADLEKVWSFNSGVIGLPGGFDPDILDRVARFCDFVCRDAPRKMEWVEQFAYSYIFQCLGIRMETCTDDVLHYWRDSFNFSRQIRNYSTEMLHELGRDKQRVYRLIEAGKSRERSFTNQVLVRTKRLRRSLRKRRRELLVYMEALKRCLYPR
ncbi:MAG: hypothetical protein AB9866_01880 [Syntrophobacteraceae bacterium]